MANIIYYHFSIFIAKIPWIHHPAPITIKPYRILQSLAYSKLGVHAFEKDIKLAGDSYTIFVDKKENRIIADVFMEIHKGGNQLAGV